MIPSTLLRASLLAVASSIGMATASAAPYTLTTGAGDGQVSVTVDGFGAFGSAAGANAGVASYNPVGPIAAASTTFQSGVALRVGTAGNRTFLTSGSFAGSGNLTNPTVTGTSTTGASSFMIGSLLFALSQSVTSLFSGGVQNGSRLDQVYTITNTGTTATSFELIRYLDGDLLFDGSLADGGGLINGLPRTLFETDSATGSATSTTFVGINASGGTQGSYEIASYSGLETRIIAGTALSNTVEGDGADADTFIDAGNGYDVTLALSNLFTLTAGGTTTYTTQTLFGSGAPSVFVAVPEPASMALLATGLLGLGLVRRRKDRDAS